MIQQMLRLAWLALVALLALPACAPPGDTAGEVGVTGEAVREVSIADGGEAEVSVAVAYDLATLDPHAVNTVGAHGVLSNVYEPLVTLDREMRIRPALAVSWETLDPRTWAFTLRETARFHDGAPVTSRDVVYSLERLLRDRRLEMGSYLAAVEEVESLGENRVVVRTKWPSSDLVSRLHFAFIVPEGATSDSLDDHPNGTGPYRVVSWIPRESIRLHAADQYWGAKPLVERLAIDFGVSREDAYRAIHSQRYEFLDVAANDVREAALTSGNYESVSQQSIFVRHLGFDVARQETPFVPGRPNPFALYAVREAIHLALDRERIAAAVGGDETVATQLVPRGITGHDPTLPLPAHDLDRARELMAEAGLSDGFDVVLHRSGFRLAAEAVKEQLAQIGISVTIEKLPSTDFFAALNRRELSFWILASGCPTGDGLELLQTAFHSQDDESVFGVDNYGGYRLAELDAEIRSAGAIFDQLQRRKKLQTLLRRVLDDRIWIPLYHSKAIFIVKKSLVYEPRYDTYLSFAGLSPAE